MVERTMATETDYISELKELICGKNDSTASQVQDLVERVIRKEYWVDNGSRPNGKQSEYDDKFGTGRVRDLLTDKDLSNPRYYSKSIDDNTTTLQHKSPTDDRLLNNNPEYRPNMIEVLNTPFDHIERIVLQDLSGVMGLPDGENNYFKGLFKFSEDSDGSFHGGIPGFEMFDGSGVSDFKDVNNVFKKENNQSIGGFFVDSFTYTPFVDYSQVGEGGDARVGVYSDQFLTDYNTGKYDQCSDNQIDKYRHTLSSNLYELMNLKKDLEDAKVAFRDAITYQDGEAEKTYQVYIYTLCEHLASLFAKLSNIRMSHEIYGFNHPHYQWEGILALDIWYNLLYKQIDAKYPFDDKFMDMNPMSRLKIQNDESGEYVQYSDDVKMYKDDMPDGFEWMADETSSKFAYIWDATIWSAYYDNSQRITDTRKECTTPRGVLGKIYRIVKELEYKWESYLAQRDSDGDYVWFEQPGKVYSHWDKWDESNKYTKYVNLHLGRAYKVMSGREYFALMKQGHEGDAYTKPDFSTVSNKRILLDNMMDAGFRALLDAFAVVQNEHLFNVFNS